MAAQTCTWTGDGDNTWNDPANWSTSVEVDRVPANGDLVVFANAENCTLDVSSATLSDLDMTGYTGTLAFGINVIDVTGNCILGGTTTASLASGVFCSGDFEKLTGMPDLAPNLTITLDGNGEVKCNSVAGGILIIDTSGGAHVAIDTGLWDKFTLTLGAYVDGANAHTISGNLVVAAGTFTSTGDWTMDTDAELSIAGNNGFGNLIIDGTTTVTASGNFVFQKLTIAGGGTINQSGPRMIIIRHPAVDFWQVTNGNINLSVVVRTNSAVDRSPGNDITINDFDFIVDQFTGGKALKLAGANLDVGTGDIIIGQSTRDSRLDLGSGNVVCANISENTSGTPTLDVATAAITLSGTFEGSGMTVVGEATNGGHATVNGGTVQNVSMPLDDDALDCTNEVTDGGGWANVWFSGTNGGHQIIGGGIVGSAEAA